MRNRVSSYLAAYRRIHRLRGLCRARPDGSCCRDIPGNLRVAVTRRFRDISLNQRFIIGLSLIGLRLRLRAANLAEPPRRHDFGTLARKLCRAAFISFKT